MKIIGLLAGKGEGKRVIHCLKAMAEITDEIIYLDDNSPDDTLDNVQSMTRECKVVRVINREPSRYDESYNRNLLLRAGRELSGSGFLVVDSDESFAVDASLTVRTAIEALNPGECLSSPLIHLWKSANSYRVDPSPLIDDRQPVAFCDDGVSWYSNKWMDVPRVPVASEPIKLPSEAALLHFKFICWPNVVIKQAWYQYLEKVKGSKVQDLNSSYLPLLEEIGVKTEDTKPEWFHPFFDEADFQTPYLWRINEMRDMERGKESEFTGLIGADQAAIEAAGLT